MEQHVLTGNKVFSTTLEFTRHLASTNPLIQGDRQREQTIIRESRETLLSFYQYYNVEDHDLNCRLKLDATPTDPRDPPVSIVSSSIKKIYGNIART